MALVLLNLCHPEDVEGDYHEEFRAVQGCVYRPLVLQLDPQLKKGVFTDPKFKQLPTVAVSVFGSCRVT